MKRENIIDLATVVVAFIALGLVLTGIWWCWPPLAMIVAGAVLLSIVGILHDRRKKK